MKEEYDHFSDNLKFLLEWTEEQKGKISEINYADNDVRKDYFRLSYTNVYHYYIGYFSLFASKSFGDELIRFDKSLFGFKSHINRFIEISLFDQLSKGNFNILNQRVFVFAWSIFELSLSTFFSAVVDDDELQALLEYDYADVLKCVTIKEGKEGRLKALLIKNNIAHISINRKYNLLFKKVKGYSRSIKYDKEFLEFFGKLRNTMHSNFIYFGKDYEYRFGDAHFIFRDNREVVWIDPFENGYVPAVRLYTYLIGQLNLIFFEISRCIPFEPFIPYPDTEAE